MNEKTSKTGLPLITIADQFMSEVIDKVGKELGERETWRFVLPQTLWGEVYCQDIQAFLQKRGDWSDVRVEAGATTQKDFLTVTTAFNVYFEL